jgi:fused-like protein
MDAILNGRVTHDGLIIAAHFARLSGEFVGDMLQAGLMPYLAQALRSDVAVIRARAASCVGNLCKHVQLPVEFADSIVQALVDMVRDGDAECRKFACFALGNEVYHTNGHPGVVAVTLDSIAQMLDGPDRKMLEFAAYLVANVVRKHESYVGQAIKSGVLEKLAAALSDPEKVEVVIQPISVFCLSPEGRKALKAKGLSVVLQKLLRRGSDIVKTTAQTILSSIDA